MHMQNYKKPATIFQYPLKKKEHVYYNYLIPISLTIIVYILNFTADSCLALQHIKEENHLYASLTFFLLYIPIISSLLFNLSNVDIWPEEKGMELKNIKWLFIKIIQHIFFPIWAMYRFAEQLFWSIEAVRATNNNEIDDFLKYVEKNHIFELYHFLQAYLQAAPQILLQLHIVFNHKSNFNTSTVNMQVFSITMSLIKMAITTSSYQRFKSQKLAGKQYPWKKDVEVHINTIQLTYNSNILLNNPTEVPKELDEVESENSDTEADRDNILSTSRKSSGLSQTSSQFDNQQNHPDFPQQNNEHKEDIKNDETDKNNIVLPLQVVSYRGLPEDDVAGKLVSIIWWFCFLLARMLTLSAFAYFYRSEIWWICFTHYMITLAFLLYDAHTSDIPYYRAVFILFTAYIYVFCLIEFKIKFKKVAFIYKAYFIMVFIENIVMTSIWYYKVEAISDWWYKYVFSLILGSCLLSSLSMLFYIFILKPKKIVYHKEFRNSKVL